jgi:peptidoglycan/LPS O-acetylase OafA/YrhL
MLLRLPSETRYRHVTYRADIDGLRAVAVLAVVAFHAFPDLLPGGFVGVDIFFVISGYLICGIIFRSLEAGGFSFAEFYARRIRRIFPALILMLAAVLVVGWFVLIGPEYKTLGLNAAGGAAFASNFLLWQQTGYFEPDARSNPLLHLWSLGVEEQFYLAWPLLLYVAWRLRIVLALTVGAILLSLAACLLLSTSDLIAAFYSPLTRLWELQAGALIAYSAPRFSLLGQNASALLGAALLVAAFLFVDEHNFPGPLILLPVAGAAALIASKGAILNRFLLANPAMVGVGLVSYPLYLWHWPLLSFAWIMNGGAPSVGVRVALIATSLMLAWATYRFVEHPIRTGAWRRQAIAPLVAGLAVAGLAGLIVVRQDGFGGRPIAMAYAKIGAAFNDCTFPGVALDASDHIVPVIEHGSSGRYVVFLGDSHMEQYWPRLDLIYRTQKPELGAIFATFQGCPPFFNSHRTPGGRYKCDERAVETLAYAHRPDVAKVVFGAAWSLYDRARVPGTNTDEMLEGFGHTIAELVLSGTPVTVILMTPAADRNTDPRLLLGNRFALLLGAAGPLANQSGDRRNFADPDLARRLTQVAHRNGATVIDPADYLCARDTCPIMVDGEPVYLNAAHIRARFIREHATFMDDLVLR